MEIVIRAVLYVSTLYHGNCYQSLPPPVNPPLILQPPRLMNWNNFEHKFTVCKREILQIINLMLHFLYIVLGVSTALGFSL